jgi:hypothetical protein
LITAASEVAGASVATGAGEPQAASNMLASTSTDNKANSFFIFSSPLDFHIGQFTCTDLMLKYKYFSASFRWMHWFS